MNSALPGCPYGDPTCPCQDGDPCHYEGDDPMLVQPQFVRNRLDVKSRFTEQLLVQLSGVLTALEGHKPDPPVKQGDYGWSLAYERAMEARQCIEELKRACSETQQEVTQALGRTLGYPWFKDDQKNFPGATEADGVCVGDHVAESMASEAANRIAKLEEALEAAHEACRYESDCCDEVQAELDNLKAKHAADQERIAWPEVDAFAESMRAKLVTKDTEGRSGWDDPANWLGMAAALLEHVNRLIEGDRAQAVDVANFAMFLHLTEPSLADDPAETSDQGD